MKKIIKTWDSGFYRKETTHFGGFKQEYYTFHNVQTFIKEKNKSWNYKAKLPYTGDTLLKIKSIYYDPNGIAEISKTLGYDEQAAKKLTEYAAQLKRDLDTLPPLTKKGTPREAYLKLKNLLETYESIIKTHFSNSLDFLMEE